MIKTVVIVGPTASGKTGLSLELASRFNGQIVSADSMQIYRDMDIGTAKASLEERARIKHHMLDLCNIGELYSVASYAENAKKCIESIHSEGAVPFIVGGTGLYVDSVIQNTKFAEYENGSEIREELNAELVKYGQQYMHDKLSRIDPEAAAKLHVNDSKRVLRALELYMITGSTKTKHDLDSHVAERYCEPLYIGLNFADREKLYERINLRVEKLFELGLEKEVRDLLNKGLKDCKTAYQAIGYKEIVEYIEGRLSRAEAMELLKLNTRRYAKRQLTWFRRNKDINWLLLDSDFDNSPEKLIDHAAGLVEDFLK